MDRTWNCGDGRAPDKNIETHFMIRIVDFKKAAFAGVLGAAIWEGLLRIIHLYFPQSLDLIYGLGTLVNPNAPPLVWWTAGMLVHLTVGAIWAVFYCYFFWSLLPIRPAFQGAVFSIIQTIAAGLFITPQMATFHPLIQAGKMPDPGLFSIHNGWQGPATLIFGHLVYGLVLGSLYTKPVGYSVKKENKPLKWSPVGSSPLHRHPIEPPLRPPGNFMFCTGIECSYPTIENGKWRIDQLELNKHYQNWALDLELVQNLGIRYLRYGPPLHRIFLGPGRYDWSFMDAVGDKMQKLGIIPIIDLCHFGLPSWLGNFQNTDFPKYLSEYAEAFARRYPWIRFWNPINEMLVVARESALSGTWNEQLRSETAFVRATSNMVRASQMIIEKISSLNPKAVFITSESSEFFQACCPDQAITEKARFENLRRFIATDLLHSKEVDDDVKAYLFEHGLTNAEYQAFMGKCLSQKIIMGVDYYQWNEKLINKDGSPQTLGELFGWYVITKQYYDRYRRPIMHTETNFPDPKQGPDWIWRQWHNLQLIQKAGVPVVGFTWYSLQDQVDWNIGISKAIGNVFPVGIYDLNRDPRPVERAFRQIVSLFGNERIPRGVQEEFAL